MLIEVFEQQFESAPVGIVLGQEGLAVSFQFILLQLEHEIVDTFNPVSDFAIEKAFHGYKCLH